MLSNDWIYQLIFKCLFKYADALFETDWYKMPNEFQKYFIIMIVKTQKRIYLDGYGFIRLSLEGFTSLQNTFLTIQICD